MVSKIYIGIDPGNNLGIATLRNGILCGKTYDIKRDSPLKQFDAIDDAIMDSLEDWGTEVQIGLLWTRFINPKMNTQSLMNYIGTMYIVRLSLESMFDSRNIELFHDDTARSIVFCGRKMKKPEAHAQLSLKYDLSHLTTNARGNPHKDTLDAAICVLALASRNGVNIHSLRPTETVNNVKV